MNVVIKTPFKLPIGISNFEKLIVEGATFVDKSLLIKELFEDLSQVVLLPRPRRFGKTMNMSMLHHFLRNDRSSSEINLFAGLEISKHKNFCEKHQNKYPTIFVSFKSIKENTYAQSKKAIQKLIASIYRAHQYVLDSEVLSDEERDWFRKILQEDATDIHLKNSLRRALP
ncbi:MAG: hypothetical protein COB50_05315 [Thiotrichales bacterium]|nr:MAG: hypothetical protein COB50_05315 [Thiotrichales bacterium]